MVHTDSSFDCSSVDDDFFKEEVAFQQWDSQSDIKALLDKQTPLSGSRKGSGTSSTEDMTQSTVAYYSP